MNKIYQSYLDTPTDRVTTYGQAYATIHDEVVNLIPIGDRFVPREWYNEQYRDDMNELEASMSLYQWRVDRGDKIKMFAATLDYYATGEGNLLQVIGGQAYSLGEFILSMDSKIDAYFVRGMKFHEGIPTDDPVWEMFRTPYFDNVLQSNTGSIELNLKTYVNFS